MTCQSPECKTHPEIVGFKYPMPHFRAALKSQRKVKVVAIGSSSTAGADGVLPFLPRLQMQLRETFYGSMIDVINRGVGGEEALDEASRFECDVIAEAPSLVIWQVGTNAVFHDTSYSRDQVAQAIAAGLRWLAARQIDVVLMDLQYTKALVFQIGASTVPKLPLSEDMVAKIANVAESADPKVNVFRRFALMKNWVDAGIPLDSMDDQGSDRLHTSKWATDCVARALAEAIVNSPT
jgi:acyl-CoA thioesterase-1